MRKGVYWEGYRCRDSKVNRRKRGTRGRRRDGGRKERRETRALRLDRRGLKELDWWYGSLPCKIESPWNRRFPCMQVAFLHWLSCRFWLASAANDRFQISYFYYRQLSSPSFSLSQNTSRIMTKSILRFVYGYLITALMFYNHIRTGCYAFGNVVSCRWNVGI